MTDYAIEVAALRSKDCAVELANGLLSRGFDAYWLKANQPEYGVSYRVRVGKFQNLDIARNYAENLLDSGLLDTCAITIYETPLYSLAKASGGSQNSLPIALGSLPVNSSCPINISDNKSSNHEDLIAALSKNKWLLSSSQSVIYSLPPKRSVSTVRDVVV
ncbi:MAG: SPOR domain-containing protein, partial [Acidobacteria bacterium]|nr:SPOR domain-containing protein [Acidobacteriota bacterium]